MTPAQQKQLFIISGPSGAGKTTIYKKIFAEHPELNFSVSVTTRPPRNGEVDGVDYYFIDSERFQQLVTDGAFAEWATVHGNSYGTLKKELESKTCADQKCLLDVDVQGADSLRKIYPEANYIFIIPPSREELRRRLLGRGSEHSSVQETRLQNAEKELEHRHKFDYVIENDIFEKAYATVESIIFHD